jgi:hypothetical protein
MKRFYVITKRLLVIGFALVGCVHQPSSQSDAGWITLFDGSNLDNWQANGKANWRLEDRLLQVDKGNGHMVSKDSYSDFQIRAEFWVDAERSHTVVMQRSPCTRTLGTLFPILNDWNVLNDCNDWNHSD